MDTEIRNVDDIIDSRDIIARIEELIELSQEPEWTIEENDELTALQAVAAQAEHYGDWEYGETLIRDSYFVDYCEELVKDIGDLPRDLPGYLAIDWDATADNLRADYMSVDFDGQTYWMRS